MSFETSANNESSAINVAVAMPEREQVAPGLRTRSKAGINSQAIGLNNHRFSLAHTG